VFDEHVELLERIGIEEKLHPLARGQFSARVLGGDSRLASAKPGTAAAFIEIEENLLHAEPAA
jgi:hypothetical protein